jgi:integrase
MARTVWSVSEFINSLATESTKRNYQSGLKFFFSFVTGEKFPARNYQERLDSLSIDYVDKFLGDENRDDREYEKHYTNYQKSIKDKFAPKTVELRMLAVRGFFEVNDLKISRGLLIRVNGRKAVEAISDEKIPKREEVKLILQHLPLHLKCYVLFILSGGFRPAEPLTLKLSDMEQDGDLIKIHLKSSSTKTGRKRWTYITPEAMQVYMHWLDSRNQFIESTSNAISNIQKREEYLSRNVDKVFPFSYNTANKVWVTAVKKAGLLERDENTNRLTLRLHNLRKYFSTRGKWSDRDIPDFLQGHISGVRAIYNRYDQAEEVVKKAYIDAIPSLTIEEYADTGKVEELESRLAENQQQTTQVNMNINFLLTENRELKDKMRTIENEARLQKLEFESQVNKTNRLESEIGELRQNLMMITSAGLRIMPSRIIVTGEAKLDEYENLGYELEEELSPESPNRSIIDEEWELPDGHVLGKGDKVYASINQNGTVEMRGNPNLLNDVEKELVEMGISLDKIGSGPRYLLRKKKS